LNKFFVTGIGTGVGKTIVSAVLTEALQGDYWKPIQAGNVEQTDSMIVRSLVSREHCTVHPESYRLKAAKSPHAASKLENIDIRVEQVNCPTTDRTLIIEGAGGLMVPLNNSQLTTDLIRHLSAPVILVSQNYLGSINHTLLSVAVIRQLELPFVGIIFSGISDPGTEEILSHHAPIIGHVKRLDPISHDAIRQETKTMMTHPFWKPFTNRC